MVQIEAPSTLSVRKVSQVQVDSNRENMGVASCAIHPITFRGSGWEYMVQIDSPITPECWEGVPSPGGQ